jgi:hypothetical protein
MARVFHVAAFALFSSLANVGRGSSAEDGCSGSPFSPSRAFDREVAQGHSGGASCQQIPVSRNTSRGKKPRLHDRFTPDEDDCLYQLVDEFGINNWNEIVARMPGRNWRQCRDRWKHYLSVGWQRGGGRRKKMSC